LLAERDVVKLHSIMLRHGAVALGAFMGFVGCIAFSGAIYPVSAGSLEDDAPMPPVDCTGAAEQWRPLALGGDPLA
jgi:TPR repeat protein